MNPGGGLSESELGYARDMDDPAQAPTRLLPDVHALAGEEEYGYRSFAYVVVFDGFSLLIDVSHRRFIPELVPFPPPRYLLLTHRHTRRDEAEYERHFGLRVFLRAEDALAMRRGPAANTPMAQSYGDPFTDPHLAELGFRFLHAPGHTAGYTFILWNRHDGVLFSGDAVIGRPKDAPPDAPALTFPPEDTSDDDAHMRASVAALEVPAVRHVLPFHGDPCIDLTPSRFIELWQGVLR